jgi:hypothetical protein
MSIRGKLYQQEQIRETWAKESSPGEGGQGTKE